MDLLGIFQLRSYIKRIIDIIGALIGLIVFGPILLVFGTFIQIWSRGGFFYIQQRVGLNGERFYIFKLRTMHKDCEQRLTKLLDSDLFARLEYQKYQCLKNDPRVAGLWAKLARKYSIDEIPQFINVLLGDMSLVGPRPLSNADMDSFVPKKYQSLRLTVKPGITGLWQVSRKGKHEITHNMIDLDIKYINEYSLFMDIKIILKTGFVVLAGTGQF
jgi:lipopolysaccharide/colanic/teichoic acid biosynthesis glycosyltransferase